MTTYLVGVLEGPSVNAVVRGIELALWEPGNVTLLEAAVLNSLERDIPVNGLATELKVRSGGLTGQKSNLRLVMHRTPLTLPQNSTDSDKQTEGCGSQSVGALQNPAALYRQNTSERRQALPNWTPPHSPSVFVIEAW